MAKVDVKYPALATNVDKLFTMLLQAAQEGTADTIKGTIGLPEGQEAPLELCVEISFQPIGGEEDSGD